MPPAPTASAKPAWKRPDRAEPRRSSPSRNPATATPAASPNETSPDMSSSSPPHEFDAAVLRLAFVGVVGGNGLGAAIARCREAARRQPGLDQIVDHRLRALFRQCLVETVFAIAVGVAGNLDVGGRTAQRNLDQTVEQTNGIRIDGGAP